jgi:xanthine/CO dehydrogenase XdhC/CoxF family maturation factor
VEHADFSVGWGIEQDAHAGNWHRQVSLLSWERIEEFRQKGAEIDAGAFGENLVVEGFDFKNLPLGTRFRCGEVLLEMTQIGKECHNHCQIYQKMGDCIMPREGVFAVVLEGGTIHRGDEMMLIPSDLYQTLADRDPVSDCVLATILDGADQGAKCLWIDGIRRWSSPGCDRFEGWKEEILSDEGSRMLEKDGVHIFCEKIGSRKDLVICGAGHVSMPIIQMGKSLGFHVTVIDDRPLFANQARRAQADVVICDRFEAALEQISGSKDTYFVIVTRGHRYDTDCLRRTLRKPNAYIGMMGSRKRVHLVKQKLLEEGADRETLEAVHTPIGLSIGAETPEEIAVSVMAQIIQVKNQKKRISGYDRELLSYLAGEERKGRRALLCTIVSRSGSAPREIGTKMLLLEDGTIVGTIGGGCAESSVIQKGLQMLREGSTYALEEVDMTGREAEEEGMVCGGRIWIFMEALKNHKI